MVVERGKTNRSSSCWATLRGRPIGPITFSPAGLVAAGADVGGLAWFAIAFDELVGCAGAEVGTGDGLALGVVWEGVAASS